MTRELFIESLTALQKQYEHDKLVASHLAKAFPNAFEPNLLPDNHFLSNALLKILQEENHDTDPDESGQSWIEYFCFELDFGKKFKPGMIKEHGKNVDFSTAGKVWDYLNRKN